MTANDYGDGYHLDEFRAADLLWKGWPRDPWESAYGTHPVRESIGYREGDGGQRLQNAMQRDGKGDGPRHSYR